jgi:hypothetical protein
MTQDDIIRMAREAGFDAHDMSADFTCNLKDIERFAELVRADERAALEHLKAYGYAPGGYMMTCRSCNTVVIDVDKRASRCKPCAIKAFNAQQEPKQSEIFCGVDIADGVLSVSVLRRRTDNVAELIHCEQIELPAQPAQTDWEAVAADQAMTIAMLRAEQPAQSTADKSKLETVPAKGGLLPAQQEENLYAYAGVKIWVGNTQASHFISRTAIEHEAIKGMCLHMAADWCLQELKERT